MPKFQENDARVLTSATKVEHSVFIGIFASAAGPALLTVAMTSGMSPWSHQVFFFLGVAGRDEQTTIFVKSIEVGVAMLVIGYIADLSFVQGWLGEFAAKFYMLFTGVFLFGGVLGLTPTAPSIPIIFGLALTVLAVVSFRKNFCADTPVEEFSIAAGLAFLMIHATLAAVWGLWAFSPLFGGYTTWSSHEQVYAELGFQPLTSFVMWSSPVIVSIGCLIAAIFSIARSQFHVPDNSDQPLDAKAVDYVQGELKTLMLCIGFAVVSAWIAASLGARDFALAESVLRLGVSTLVGAVIFVSSSIGLERIGIEAEKSQAIRESLVFLTSDWCKGLFLLLSWPLIPVYFAFETLHQAVRWCLWGSGPASQFATDPQPAQAAEPLWLAQEARSFWQYLDSWDKASVLTKTMYVGLGLFALMVIPSQALPLFLSWLNEQIAGWPLIAILFVLFFAGMCLFLLPPVPGLPIYLLTGVIVTEKCAKNGMGFEVGCFISIAFSYFLKMSACAVQMRGIGGSLSGSVAVKKAIGVHTPAMKAIKHILSKEGFHMDKIAVLCGGPDWPTYVTAGILNLRVSEMLLGGSPVVFMIIPFCLTSAFTTHAGHESNPDKAQYYLYLSSVMAIASSLVMLCYMSTAGYFIHRTAEGHREDFDHGELGKDCQEGAVLASIEADERAARSLARCAGWHSMPMWLKSLMLLGGGLCSTMTHVLLEPVPALDAFRDFKTTDSISSLPGGSPLAILLGPGWFCVGCFATACCILMAQSSWSAAQSRNQVFAEKDGEETDLLLSTKEDTGSGSSEKRS